MISKQLTIGQIAKETGLTAKAVRLYEQQGIIDKPKRTQAGYRIYQADDVALLNFVRQAKLLGLQLDEIKRIVDLHRRGSKPCQTVLSLLSKRIDEIDIKVADLKSLRRKLSSVCERAKEQQKRGDGSPLLKPDGKPVLAEDYLDIAPILRSTSQTSIAPSTVLAFSTLPSA